MARFEEGKKLSPNKPHTWLEKNAGGQWWQTTPPMRLSISGSSSVCCAAAAHWSRHAPPWSKFQVELSVYCNYTYLSRHAPPDANFGLNYPFMAIIRIYPCTIPPGAKFRLNYPFLANIRILSRHAPPWSKFQIELISLSICAWASLESIFRFKLSVYGDCTNLSLHGPPLKVILA